MHHHPARLGATDADYTRLGIERGRIAEREDGMRTDGGKGTFEWWYFDAALDDGSKLVIDFATKDPIKGMGALAPFAEIQYDGPDGTHIEAQTSGSPDEFTAATDTCDVRMGPNTFAGDLHSYRIHIETDRITADVELTGEVPPWRPQTGHFLFEDDGRRFFAWLPAVPKGRVRATLSIGGQSRTLTGLGYHDHNWGNVDMMKVLNHWYWGRAQIGPYTVIACYLTATKRYGFAELPVFLLAEDGHILADDADKVLFAAAGSHVDEPTGKPAADLLTYTYDDGDEHTVVTWRRQRTILRQEFIDDVSGWKHLAAKLIGFDGAYLRFTGDVEIRRAQQPHTGEAIWELMYFGKTHESEVERADIT